MTIRDIDKELLDACSALDEKRVLEALLAGADPNCFEDYEYPLLACLHSDGYDSKFFPGRNNSASDDEAEDTENTIPDSVYDAYDREADRRRIRIFGLLIEHGVDLNNDFGDFESILWYAVHNSPRIVDYLLQKGANPNPKCEGFDDTPLMHAWTDESLYHNDKKIADRMLANSRALLSYGALPYTWEEINETSIDLSEIRTFEHVPPFVHPEMPENIKPLSEEDKKLFQACKDLDFEAAIKALDMGANVNARNVEDDFATPLFIACRHSAFNDSSDESDWTSDKMAERIDAAFRMASMLLSRGADSNLTRLCRSTIDGKEIIEADTTLMLTAWLAKNVDFSKLLLEHGANPNFATPSVGAPEETVMDLNCLDYDVDDLLEVKAIETLLKRFGGCMSYIFKPTYCQGMRDMDAALVFSCQRMLYHSFQVAAKLGGDLSVTDDYGRTLPVIVLEDVPQLCGKHFSEKGWELEDSIIDFLLFLLVGMKVPTTQDTRSRIVDVCTDEGYEKTLQVLRTHHVLGRQFSTLGE